MISICHKCGETKPAPASRCSSCGVLPESDDELALSFMLTEKFLSRDKLVEAAKLLRSGQTIQLPPDVRSAVIASIHAARNQQATSRHQSSIGLRGWAIIAGIIGVLFLIFHPWPHYQWSSFRDSVSSYEGFVSRFPRSDFSDSARERIRVLSEDEVWDTADASSDIDLLRNYRKVYPDGQYLASAKEQIRKIADDRWSSIATTTSRSEVLKFQRNYPETSKTQQAEARLVEIADLNWSRISSSRSLATITDFLQDYPETSKREDVEKRIQELYNDWEWVREQDSLEHYQRFAARFPSHPQSSWLAKRIIDLEVKEIAAGEYGEMPRAQPLKFGGTTAKVEVENQTGYELTVRYSGPDSKKLVIPKGMTKTVSLPPGDYKVAASVTASNVRNYYGTDTMRGGQYSSNFYIQTDYGGFSLPSYTPKRKR